MSEILQGLRDDHAEIGRVLDVLEGELGRLESGAAPDAAALGEAVTYLRGYSARDHHEKEDRVLRKLRARDAAAAAAAGDLDDQHQELLTLTAGFTDAAEGILRRSPRMPPGFLDKTRRFVNAYRRHIELEERFLFPAALWSLTAEDWKALEAEIDAAGPDRDDMG